MEKEYNYILDQEDGKVRKFDSLENASKAVDELFNKWGIGSWVTKKGNPDIILYQLEA